MNIKQMQLDMYKFSKKVTYKVTIMFHKHLGLFFGEIMRDLFAKYVIEISSFLLILGFSLTIFLSQNNQCQINNKIIKIHR